MNLITEKVKTFVTAVNPTYLAGRATSKFLLDLTWIRTFLLQNCCAFSAVPLLS